MSFLTIFIAPKPFEDAHIVTIQRNAIRSWTQLGPDVEILLIGDEHGIQEEAVNLGVRYLPDVKRNKYGTPLISSIFDLARESNDSCMLAYVNADILLMSDFLHGARTGLEKWNKFMIVGQRWDLEILEELDFSSGWESRIQERIDREGRLHPRGGSDYFIYPRSCFEDIPDFAIGRAGWDNWMFYESRRRGWPVIDATGSINIIHQDHDYSHLPNGQAHYRLPETTENIRLAGGPRSIFTLLDVNYRLVDGHIQREKKGWKKFWRELEIFPLIKLNSYLIGQLFFGLFHPIRAYREFRTWLSRTNGKVK
jgi:hypothetical protein